MALYFILAEDGKTPIATQDLMLWAQGREDFSKWVVAKTHSDDEKVTVSTVFLGMDHSWDRGTPVLFETLVFGGQHDGRMNRYCTWDEAERGHKVMCGIVGIAWGNFGKAV